MTGGGAPGDLPEGRSRRRDRLGPEGAGFLLGVAHRSRRRHWEACLADLGLSAPQAAVLRAVAAQPGQGVRHLARRLGTDPMNAQRIVESLVAAGLCKARRDPDDGRRRPLYPTARGRRLARSAAERALRVEQALADALGEERYRSLLADLQAVIDHDHGTGGGSPPTGSTRRGA